MILVQGRFEDIEFGVWVGGWKKRSRKRISVVLDLNYILVLSNSHMLSAIGISRMCYSFRKNQVEAAATEFMLNRIWFRRQLWRFLITIGFSLLNLRCSR